MASTEPYRFAIVSPDDKQGWLWVVSLLSLIYSFATLGARAVIKWGHHGADDVALGIAYVLSFGHWIIIYVALSDGLGKAAFLVTDQASSRISQFVFTSRILLLITMSLTKCSVCLFVRQLFTRGNHRAWTVCTIGAGIMVAWAVISPLIVSVGCAPSRTVDPAVSAFCAGDITRWWVVAALDLILECTLVVATAYMLWGVQVSLMRKVAVVVGFAFRIIDALLVIAYVVSYGSFLAHGRPNVGMFHTLVWQEALLCYTLMSATIPVMKGFIGRFTTIDLVRIDQSGSGLRSNQYGSNQKGRTNDSCALSSLDKSGDSKTLGKRDDDMIELRPMVNAQSETHAYHEHQAREDDSIASNGSEKMIIHRRVDWEVREEAA